MCDERNSRKQGENIKSSSLFVIDDGKQTTYSGVGNILDEFNSGQTIKSYSGQGSEPAKFYDVNFDKATLRYMKFDQAYHKVLPYDSRTSKYM